MNLTVNGVLPIGVEIEGTLHKAFELSPTRVRHSIEAMEEHGDIGQARLNMATLARRLTLEGRPVTLDQVLDLHDSDIGVIYAADDDLKKKLLQSNVG